MDRFEIKSGQKNGQKAFKNGQKSVVFKVFKVEFMISAQMPTFFYN